MCDGNPDESIMHGDDLDDRDESLSDPLPETCPECQQPCEGGCTCDSIDDDLDDIYREDEPGIPREEDFDDDEDFQ